MTTTNKLQTLKENFIFGQDSKGLFTSMDFNYIKECSKKEFGIELELIDIILQSDDQIRKYFIIK